MRARARRRRLLRARARRVSRCTTRRTRASAGQPVKDIRGQGSGWSPGDTPDPVGGGPAFPGFMTRGVLDPHDCYYRRVFIDAGPGAVRAVPPLLRG